MKTYAFIRSNAPFIIKTSNEIESEKSIFNFFIQKLIFLNQLILLN
jgi:hypothetical protein